MTIKKAGFSSLRAGTGLLAVATYGLTVAHAAPYHAKISAKKANATVLKKFPGKLVGKTALENEEGKWQYSVNVKSGDTLREVMVDADTGKIADIEVTTAAKEAAENAAEAKDKGKKEEADEKDKADEKGEKAEKHETSGKAEKHEADEKDEK